MNYLAKSRFLRNLQIPWIERLMFDALIFTSPFWLVMVFPYTFYHFGHEGWIKSRRRDFDGVFLDRSEGNSSPEETEKFYKELGFKYSY